MYLCGSNQSRKETLENKRYNNVEEWANTLSHGAGILLGVIAGYFLLAKAAAGAEPKWAVACVTVYLFGMLSSYVSSTWYHGSHRAYHSDLADIVSKRKPSGRVHHFNTMLHHSTQKFLPPEPRNNVLSSAQGQ